MTIDLVFLYRCLLWLPPRVFASARRQNVSICFLALSWLDDTNTSPVEPLLTATRVSWQTLTLLDPLYSSPMTGPSTNQHTRSAVFTTTTRPVQQTRTRLSLSLLESASSAESWKSFVFWWYSKKTHIKSTGLYKTPSKMCHLEWNALN